MFFHIGAFSTASKPEVPGTGPYVLELELPNVNTPVVCMSEAKKPSSPGPFGTGVRSAWTEREAPPQRSSAVFELKGARYANRVGPDESDGPCRSGPDSASGRKRQRFQRHPWTVVEDAILVNGYGASRASSHEAIERVLEMHPDWSRDAVVWRARVLGLTQLRTAPVARWTSTHDHLLLSLMGCQVDTIARRLNRSKKSVLARLRKLGWSADFFGGFKTKDLVVDLRVPEATVNSWVRSGWLKRKKGRITEDSLRWVCRHHPEEIPFETLAPEMRNWLLLSMDYGRRVAVRHDGRRTKNPEPDEPGTEGQGRAVHITS